MKEIVSTITSKGQVTIPAEVRRHLGLKKHDKISFVIETEGGVRLIAPRYPTIASLRGAAGSLKSPLPWAEMREIAREDHLRPQDQSQNGGSDGATYETGVSRTPKPEDQHA